MPDPACLDCGLLDRLDRGMGCRIRELFSCVEEGFVNTPLSILEEIRDYLENRADVDDGKANEAAHLLGKLEKLMVGAQKTEEALRAFVAAEGEWRSEIMESSPGSFDDPLADAYQLACAALGVKEVRCSPPA